MLSLQFYIDSLIANSINVMFNLAAVFSSRYYNIVNLHINSDLIVFFWDGNENKYIYQT